MECPQCLKPLQPVGKFWICLEHGQIDDIVSDNSMTPIGASPTPSLPLSLKAEAPQKIFLSYGHDEFAEEATKIKADLERRGHTVWFDLERLKAGLDWEAYIEEGLRQCDKVVLLMTPHSVRRPNGYCLNEIAKALEARKFIIPVLLVELTGGAPVSISRVQYLDLRDGVPSAARPERYESGFQRLARAIEHEALDFEGEQARLLRVLDPLDFRAEIAPHLARFTGREWLFAILDDWLANQTASRIFWIVGGPGLGKSAISAKLSNRSDVRALHFCVHLNTDKSDPRRAVLSLAYQLSQQFPEYGKKLSTLHLEAEQGKDAPTLFDNLIVRPLQGADIPVPSQPQLVVIDALDEATRDGRNELVEFIASYWSHTPSWLKLVITSRPEIAVTSRLHQPQLQPFVLDALRDDHLADLRKYLLAGLAKLALSASAPIVDEIIDRSEGVFLYITTLLEELQCRRLSLDSVDEFPRGMAGHYQRFFARQFPQIARYETDLLPVLKSLVAQRGPLPLDLLATATHLTDVELRKRLSALGSLFPISGGTHSGEVETVSPFHKSIVDWLTGIDMTTRLSLAGVFVVDRSAGEQLLADAVWSDYLRSPGAWSSYLLRNLPVHLRLVGRWNDAVAALTDLNYLGARVQAGQVFELVLENDAVQRALPDEMLRQRLLPWTHFLQSNASFLGEHTTAFFQQALNEPVLSSVSQAAQQRLTLVCRDGNRTLRSFDRIVPPAFLEWVNRPRDWFQPACRVTLAGHEGKVTSVALSGDGSTVVSGSYDGSVKIWDVRTGECRLILDGHAGGATSVALSNDGTTVISGSYDATVKVWDARTGECRVTLAGHTGVVTAVALSGDGVMVVSGGYDDETVRVWDALTGECRLTLTEHAGGVTSVALSDDGFTIVSGSGDDTVRVWDARTGECRLMLTGHSGGISSVALSGDGKTLVSGSYDETARVWDTRIGACIATLTGHMGVVSSVSLSGDGSTIVSGAWDKTMKVWDTRTATCHATLSGHAGVITSVAVSKDGTTVISGSSDNAVKVWDARAGTCHSTLPGHARGVTRIVLSRDGSTVATAAYDKTVKVWDARTGTCRLTLEGHAVGVTCVGMSEDGSTIVSGAYDETVKIWDARTGSCRLTLEGHEGGVICVALSGDGSTIVSGAYDETARVWDGRTGECRAALIGHTGGITCATLSEDVSTVVSGSSDHLAKVWDSRTGICRLTLVGHTGGVTSVALSGDGSTIVSGSGDETVKVWDAQTGNCRVTLAGHTGIVLSVGLSGNGSTVVSGAWDQSVKVWNAQTGVCCATHPESAAEAAAAWRAIGVIKEAFQLASLAGCLYIPVAEGSPPLVVFGPFDKGVGPLANGKVLAFNSRGEAFWFQLHRREAVIPNRN